MSLKQELETNIKAVNAYDEEDYDAALDHFTKIQDTGSKIRFNIALIHATMGEHETAVEHFQAALKLDRYLAVAYFQQGVSNFLLEEYEEAKENFNDALLYLRGNMLIDYTQLGLKYRLFSCEVLFNRGLSSINMGDLEQGLNDFKYASQEKQTAEHDVIDEASQDQGEGYTVFSIPVGILYRPDESKVRNMAVRDYLGKARLIATSNAGDTGTGFRGYEQKMQSMGLSVVDLPPATVQGIRQTPATQALINAMPTSMHVLPMAQDKRAENDRLRPIPGLAQELERKPSVVSVRSQFRAPTRSASRRSADLPPTPPPSSGSMSRQTSDVSNPSSDAPDRFLLMRSGSTEKPMPMRQPSMTKDRSKRAVPMSRKGSESSYYAEENNGVKASLSASSIDSHSSELRNLESYFARVQVRNVAAEPLRSQSANSTRKSREKTRQQTNRITSEYAPKVTSQVTDPVTTDLDRYEDLVDAYLNNFKSPTDISPKQSRKPTKVTKIKCKVYGLEDARIITVEPYMDVKVFRVRLCEKFGWTRLPKLRIKDDDDDEMILLADQEDFDHICELSVIRARRSNVDVGRMEVYVKDERTL